MIKRPLTCFALLLTVHCAPAFAESIYSMQIYAADYSRGGSIDFLEAGNAVNAYAGGRVLYFRCH